MRFTVNTDGGSRGNPGIAGWGARIVSESGDVLELSGFLGHATNNVAEYTAVIHALEEIGTIDPHAEVLVRADSKLVVEQLSGAWKIKNPDLQKLALAARRALPQGTVRFQWVPRAENSDADRLANKAMDDGVDSRTGSLAPSGASPSTAEATDSVDSRGAAAPSVEAIPTRAKRPSGAAFYFGSHEPMTLVVVRHGATELTDVGGYSGSSTPGPALSESGRAQVQRAANLVARMGELWTDLPSPSAIWVSPMIRTQETAEILSGELDVPVETVDELQEIDFGQWEGLTPEDVAQRWPGGVAQWAADPTWRIPEGESTEDVAHRAARATRRAGGIFAGRTLVWVTHSIVSKVTIGSLMGVDPADYLSIRVPPASVSVLRIWPDMAELVASALPNELGSIDQTAGDTLF